MLDIGESNERILYINQNSLNTCCIVGLFHNEPKVFNGSEIKFLVISSKIKEEIESLIKDNYYIFMLGLETLFEITCAEEILILRKNNYPNIRLYCLVLNKNYAYNLDDKQKERYTKIIKQADKIIFIYNELGEDYIDGRNKILIENSSKMITLSNAFNNENKNTIEYAKKHRLQILYIET